MSTRAHMASMSTSTSDAENVVGLSYFSPAHPAGPTIILILLIFSHMYISFSKM